jgi:hypothetical protein
MLFRHISFQHLQVGGNKLRLQIIDIPKSRDSFHDIHECVEHDGQRRRVLLLLLKGRHEVRRMLDLEGLQKHLQLLRPVMRFFSFERFNFLVLQFSIVLNLFFR